MVWWCPNISNDQKNILSTPSHLLHNETIAIVQKELLTKGSPYTWFTFCNEYKNKFKIDFASFEALIINSKETKYICLFAIHIPTANHRKLEQAILKAVYNSRAVYNARWDYEWLAKFAAKVPGVNVKRFEKLVVESRHPKAAYWLLKYVKGVSVRRVKEIIIKSGKSRYIYELAKHVPLSERQELEDMIVANKSNMYVRLFAQNVTGADKKKLERRIIKTRNAEQITKFGDKVPGSKCKRLVTLF